MALVLAQNGGETNCGQLWPRLLQGYLPLFVAVNKHMHRLFLLLVSCFMFLLLPVSSGSAEYSKYHTTGTVRTYSDFGILEPACAHFAHNVLRRVLKDTRHALHHAAQVADIYISS